MQTLPERLTQKTGVDHLRLLQQIVAEQANEIKMSIVELPPRVDS